MKDAKRIWKARLIVVTVVCALVIPAIALAQGISVLDKGYKAVRLAADTPFPGVNGAAVGADGHLYVSHTGNGTITQINLKTMKAKPFVLPYRAAFILDDIAADSSKEHVTA